MRRLAALGLLCALAAVVVLAQVNVSGGGTPGGAVSSGGASFWNGTIAPSNIVGGNGDFYLNTSTYCLYGPKATGAWPATCVSLIGQSGLSGPPLGYVAENAADKGAASGYAPLNSSAQVPLINLPIIPYTQISGVQLALGFTPLNAANNLGDLSNAPTARSNLGLVIGTNVEPHSALLDGFAGLAVNGIVAVSGSSASSGTLSGDVSTNGLAATVNSVGGSTAASLHTAEMLANAATANSANSTIVMRDRSGNINAAQLYAGGTAAENTANKGKANGYAPLDGGGLLPAANLPISAVTATTVNNGTLSGSFVNLLASGPISTSATGAGAFMMTAGSSQTPPANTVGLQAPVSVPNSFNCTWWGVPASGLVHATATTPCILSASQVDLAADTNATLLPLANLPVIPYSQISGGPAPLGYTAENVANKGAANGYAPLNSSSLIAPSFLPVIPYSQISGGPAPLGYTAENIANKGAASGYAPLDVNALLPIASLPNPIVTAGVGGVTAGYLVARDTSNPTRYIATNAGGCGSGFAASTAAAGATFHLYSMPGTLVTVVADNTVTAGDVTIGGSVIPGRVADSGVTPRSGIPSTTCTIGIAQSSAVAGGTFNVLFDGTGTYGTQVSSASVVAGLGYTPAPSNSPGLTGSPTAPTQPAGDTSTLLATDAFVNGALTNGLVATNFASLTAGPTYLNPTTGYATTFDCEAYVNLTACLNAAKAYTNSNETGGGNAARILIPEGNFTLTSYPYTLTSGMQLIGVLPRLEYSASYTPTLVMVPNGGTWINCGGSQCFTGSTLRGVTLERIGFTNFTTAVSFGGNNIDGISQSKIADLVAVGNACCTSNIAFEFYNFADITINVLQAYNVNTLLHLVAQGAWCCPGNSTITDAYVSTYAKSVANGNNTYPGIWVQSLTPSTGPSEPINLLTFIRPQVNSYGGDNTGVNISISGVSPSFGANEINLIDADVEGGTLNGVYVQNGVHNHIGIATATPTITNTVYLDTAASRTVVDSDTASTTVAMATPRASGYNDNIFYGIYDTQATSFPMMGVYRLYLGTAFQGFSGTNVMLDFVNGLTVGPGAGAVSSNTAIGETALYANTTGAYSVAVGNGALIAQTTAQSNTAVGSGALQTTTTGGQNSAVGNAACKVNTAAGCTGVGYQALENSTTGAGNTAIGQAAGVINQTTGSDNTYIGEGTSNASATQRSFMTVIGGGASGNCNSCVVLGRSTDVVQVPGDTLTDVNGNPFLETTPTASAVDWVGFTNAAAGNPATVAVGAAGSDSNINLNLTSKGAGAVQINGLPIIIPVGANVQTPASDCLCAHGGDTSITGVTCNNSTDETNLTAFAAAYSILANLVQANTSWKIYSQFSLWTGLSAPSYGLYLQYGGASVFAPANYVPTGASQIQAGGAAQFHFIGASTSSMITEMDFNSLITSTTAFRAPQSIAQPQILTSAVAKNLQTAFKFVASGTASGTYTSSTGGSLAGTGTCTLTAFNGAGGTGATASVPITGGVITGGAALTITNTGSGYTAASTTATLGNGTGTGVCSGTATIVTVLGGAQGNAVCQVAFVVTKE